MKILAQLSLLIGFILIAHSCGDTTGTGGENTDNYDRKALLTDLADQMIMPGYEQYVLSLEALETASKRFVTTKDEENFRLLKINFRTAYKAWQKVSIFEIGKAESISLRNFTNTYPTNTNAIQNAITTQNYNLTLPSTIAQQGFPALDYLFYGTGNTEEEILDFCSEVNTVSYMQDLIERLIMMANEVKDDWKNQYRQMFIDNNNSSATGSLNKVVNDFLFYFEKSFRAGKVGIPAGVFSLDPLPTKVESLYARDMSKSLFIEAFINFTQFFDGKNLISNTEHESLKSYLEYLEDGEELATKISAQFDTIKLKAEELDDSFKTQIETDNSKMLALYDEMQKAVILLKVDMMQKLNIKIDFVDADGD